MQIETAFREYRSAMQQHITYFCGDEMLAMDAVSHAFTQAWMRKAMLEAMPPPAMKAWLYATARNAAVDQKRRERRMTSLPEYALHDDLSLDITDRMTVKELVQQLPQNLSIPIHMKYWLGMNATEIGKAMGIPPATVRTRIRTALGIMRKGLRGD